MEKSKLRSALLVILLLAGSLSRIIIPIENFTAIGAIALFSGAYFRNPKMAVGISLLALFISDLLIQGIIWKGKYGFPLYAGWYWVYGTFIVIVLIGKWRIKKVKAGNIFFASVMASLAHWIISDFGVWIGGCTDITTGLPFTQDVKGFVKCYYLALPFLKNFFLGTMFYSLVLFGCFEWVQSRLLHLEEESV